MARARASVLLRNQLTQLSEYIYIYIRHFEFFVFVFQGSGIEVLRKIADPSAQPGNRAREGSIKCESTSVTIGGLPSFSQVGGTQAQSQTERSRRS